MYELDDSGKLHSTAEGTEAVRAQAQIIIAHIRARLAIRLGLYILATIFIVTASLLVAFAPAGRETSIAIVATALFALAIGAAGFGTFAIKTPLLSAQAGVVDIVRNSLAEASKEARRKPKNNTRVPPAA